LREYSGHWPFKKEKYMKKILAMIVAAMMTMSFSMIAVAADEKAADKAEAKVEKKEAKKEKKEAKKEAKKEKKEMKEKKPAKKGKKEVSGC
jgi:uncharacterized protein YxeA